jgi:hypothetical protein
VPVDARILLFKVIDRKKTVNNNSVQNLFNDVAFGINVTAVLLEFQQLKTIRTLSWKIL